MIAHVVTGSPEPLAVQWLVAAITAAAFVAAVALPRGRRRWSALAVAAAGVVGVIAGWVVDAAQPGRAPYTLRIAAPAGAAPPEAFFTVCGVLPAGGTRPATDAQHAIAPFIDGVQAPLVHASSFPLSLPPGRHEVRFDLVTAGSQEFNPPASVAEDLLVTNAAPPAGPAAC